MSRSDPCQAKPSQERPHGTSTLYTYYNIHKPTRNLPAIYNLSWSLILIFTSIISHVTYGVKDIFPLVRKCDLNWELFIWCVVMIVFILDKQSDHKYVHTIWCVSFFFMDNSNMTYSTVQVQQNTSKWTKEEKQSCIFDPLNNICLLSMQLMVIFLQCTFVNSSYD